MAFDLWWHRGGTILRTNRLWMTRYDTYFIGSQFGGPRAELVVAQGESAIRLAIVDDGSDEQAAMAHFINITRTGLTPGTPSRVSDVWLVFRWR